jgi:Leu/Phe-tRNA-protein transferase
VPYEVRAKAGESAFSVVVETAKQALVKVDELLEQADVDDVSARDWSGKIMDLGALEAEAAEA